VWRIIRRERGSSIEDLKLRREEDEEHSTPYDLEYIPRPITGLV
jgi:hypothetical protein